MSKHTNDTLDAALRRLDPAPAADLTEAERGRADALFARIVATPADVPAAVEPVRSRQARRRNRLLVAAGLAGATGIAVPALLGGGGAFGSWTAEPEPLSAAATAAAGTTCRAALDVPDLGEHAVLAERRGEWTYVLLAGPQSEATCLMPDGLVAREARNGDDDFFGSYSPDPSAPPTLHPDALEEGQSMEGSTHEGWFVWTSGYVGSDVTGVTVHTSTGLDIQASVAEGRFAAWWPSVVPDSEHPSETWSYTVHLADGSERETEG